VIRTRPLASRTRKTCCQSVQTSKNKFKGAAARSYRPGSETPFASSSSFPISLSRASDPSPWQTAAKASPKSAGGSLARMRNGWPAADAELTPEGDQMAEAFAEGYRSTPWTAAYVSPMKRTIATATNKDSQRPTAPLRSP